MYFKLMQYSHRAFVAIFYHIEVGQPHWWGQSHRSQLNHGLFGMIVLTMLYNMELSNQQKNK